jgi:hypothetical protein
VRTQIVPFELVTVVYETILCNSIRIYEIGRLQILFFIYGGGVADEQWPVVDRTLQGFPETWVVVSSEKQDLL